MKENGKWTRAEAFEAVAQELIMEGQNGDAEVEALEEFVEKYDLKKAGIFVKGGYYDGVEYDAYVIETSDAGEFIVLSDNCNEGYVCMFRRDIYEQDEVKVEKSWWEMLDDESDKVFNELEEKYR